jgi:N-acetylglucosamine PTS system EIICBA or EIICB component
MGLTGSAADLAGNAWRSQQLAKLSMPVGVLSGLIAGFAYNRFSDIEMPSYLAFFGGRRFVPIATGCFGVLVAVAFGLGWPVLARGMDFLSHAVVNAGSLGLFVYGTLNRVLIVTGLHHILNNIPWFLLGDYHGATGDLKRFFAGDPTAGAFMSGFFPVMMFGLPGACLAMYRAARPERRQAVGGLLMSIALTSFLTGVTEPIEFTFMFLAPLLYVVHAVLTGLAMVVMHALGIHLGFSFSAGLFDYMLNYSLATRPLWLLPIGAGYFGLYYVVFYYGIVRFNLATPGREAAQGTRGDAASVAEPANRAAGMVAALGGAANLLAVDACTTRLRLSVAESARIDVAALTRLGAIGIVRPGPNTAQVVLGPIADQVAEEIRRYLRSSTEAASDGSATDAVAISASDLLAALGGAANVESVDCVYERALVKVLQRERVDRAALDRLAVRGIAITESGLLHVLLGAQAAQTCDALRKLLT